MACADLPFIQIHTTDESELPCHEHFANNSFDTATSSTQLQHLLDTLSLPIETALFLADNHPLVHSPTQQQAPLAMKIVATSAQPEFDALAIAKILLQIGQHCTHKYAVTTQKQSPSLAAKAQAKPH